MKRKAFSIVYIVFFVGLLGCEDILIKPNPRSESSSEGVQYMIRKGEHGANQLPALRKNLSVLRFQAKFDSSAIYQTKTQNNQADINKLYGLSDCNSMHQTNSARFGWRWYKNQLEILAYTYNDKVRDFKTIGVASLNVYHEYKIEFTNDVYVFSFQDQTVELPRNCAGVALGYTLFPYFGGDEVAPQDVSIWIKDL